MNIVEIRKKIMDGEYEFRRHALERGNLRNINPLDIKHAILHGEIIEEYPNDLRGSSCLIWGKGRTGDDIHIICGLSFGKIWIITVYLPEEKDWVDPSRRRR